MNFIRVDRWIFVLLIGIVGLFFLPLLAGWERFFYDDIAFTFYPQQVFLSRCLGEGVIPWWNPSVAAGASPFFAHPFQSALSPINWLFLLLGAVDPARDYFWLIKLPLSVYYLLGAGFSFLFARHGLRLAAGGAAVFSLAYTFSPAMIYFSTAPPEVLIQAGIPLFCLCLIRFSLSGNYRWLVLGAVAFALISPAGDIPVVVHAIFITSLFGAGLLLICLIRRDWKRGLRVAGGGIALFGIGFLLAGFYWSNMLTGILMLREGASGIIDQLSGLSQSMHPLYLINLFIPDFFGGITSHHSWGAAHQIRLSLNDVNLLGGLAAGFIMLAGFFSALRRNRGPKRLFSPGALWWLFFGIFLFGIFVVLGRYTPVYGFLRPLIPALQIPYPVRLRSIECFAMAGLLGVSIDLLGRYPPTRVFRQALVYLVLVGVLAGVALYYPYRSEGELFSPGWRQLSVLNDWGWFLAGPVFYLGVGAAALIAISAFKTAGRFQKLLIAAVSLDIILFAYPAFYRNRTLNHRYDDFYADRYFGPGDDPVYQKVLDWEPEGEGEKGLFRRLYYRSYFDNLAWLDGSLSMLGFDIKPLDHRFQEIIEELTEGFPYEIKVKNWGSRFWTNMSARYLLSREPLAVPHLERRKMVENERSYEAPSALPRFYFQDRWRLSGEDDQKQVLLNRDLRESGCCDRGDWGDLPRLEEGPDGGELIGTGLEEHFTGLQAKNRVVISDLSDPNRIALSVRVTVPSMLVVTDLYHPDWRAAAAGKPVEIHRVNYLQRGIWCPPGEYQVMMTFRPGSLTRGWWMTAIGLLALAGLLGLDWRTRRGTRYRPN